MVFAPNRIEEVSLVRALNLAGMAVIWMAASGFSWVFSGPEAELDPFWNQVDSSSDLQVDHALWQSVLDDYLVQDESGINLFDYEGVKGDDDLRIDHYIESLELIDPRNLNRSEQMSYWINFYNALTVQLVVRNYPVGSITELGEGLLDNGPWDDEVAEVAGRTVTLNDIEHRILRPIYQDHRIHFALNCASIGCPNLNNQAYSADNLDQLLSQAAKKFLDHPRGLKFQNDGLRLSKIFQWFQADFGGDEGRMLHTLTLYVNPDVAVRLRQFNGELEYSYDWALNDLQ
ncbi:MAG: DUF547 domain-containing protein [bacterium]